MKTSYLIILIIWHTIIIQKARVHTSIVQVQYAHLSPALTVPMAHCIVNILTVIMLPISLYQTWQIKVLPMASLQRCIIPSSTSHSYSSPIFSSARRVLWNGLVLPLLWFIVHCYGLIQTWYGLFLISLAFLVELLRYYVATADTCATTDCVIESTFGRRFSRG
jgi:hypothetical protein